MSVKPTSVPAKTLSQAILSSGMSFIPSNILGWDGVDLTSADFGSRAFGAFLSADRTLLELFEWDPSTVASSSITILYRGLKFDGTQLTEVTANKLDWPAGTTSIQLGADVPQIISLFAGLGNTNAFTGANSFSTSPTVPTPSGATDVANKGYVDGVTQAGGADSSTTVKGISRLSVSPNVTKGTVTITIASPAVCSLSSHGLTVNDTVQFTTSGTLPTGISPSTTYYVITAGLTANAFEIAATLGGTAINTSGSQSGTHTLIKTTPISVSDNDPRLQESNYVPNSYAASSAGTDTYAITLNDAPTAYATGQVYYFKADVANTGACTLNVNSLGAKSLKMNTGLDPVDGYIKAGALVQVQYDGTNLQILSVSGKPSVSQTGEELYAADAGANDTYVITLNPAPVAYVTGMIIHFKANTANTGAATINVNGLGAKTIVKGVNTTLADGDIAALQLCDLIYDGTNFVLQSPTANTVTASSYVGAVTSGSISATGNTDTTFTTNFPPGVITIYYTLQGNNSGDKYTTGIATYSGTTLTGNTVFLQDGAVAGAFTQGTFAMNTTAPKAGNAGDIIITMTVSSVTATTFVVRMAVSRTGGTATYSFYPVATK